MLSAQLGNPATIPEIVAHIKFSDVIRPSLSFCSKSLCNQEVLLLTEGKDCKLTSGFIRKTQFTRKKINGLWNIIQS